MSTRGNPPKPPRTGYTASVAGASGAGLKRTVSRRTGAPRGQIIGLRIGNHQGAKRLAKNGEAWLTPCKRWRREAVGVNFPRESHLYWVEHPDLEKWAPRASDTHHGY